LARRGAVLLGRAVDIDGDQVRFDDSAAAYVAAGDAAADRVRDMIDELICRTGLTAPQAAPDDAGGTLTLNPPDAVDLRAERVTTVIWCTGFTGDFTWLAPPLRDAHSGPRRDGVTGAVPGLWYLGLTWLPSRGSALLNGMPIDAAAVADAIRRHLHEP
jgi:putative flavoprotein involved in K+ transport